METETVKTVKHTPLPWKTHNWYHWPNDVQTLHHVSIETVDETSEIVKAQRPEDAEFIVRACNSHYELLEALQGLLTQVTRDCSIGSDPKYFDLLEKCQDAHQALKKANLLTK